MASEEPESQERTVWLMLGSVVPYLIVFTASACTLILEIVAGRILAPVIGVSLYTWTSIIGVVLAGISVGNYLGGLTADRFPARLTLGIILLVSGVFNGHHLATHLFRWRVGRWDAVASSHSGVDGGVVLAG